MDSIKTAFALAYPAGAEAPFIVAKTKGLLAEKLIELAKEKDIPVNQDEALAGVLSMYDVGACVPPETYEALAKIFAFIQRHERQDLR